ncbi:MAG: peptidoglycan DD-metalloendopeptidase family protein [Proteobacteria bacterium]|nr:peptidoglycan DD-metalloendopeptidase family protein [Pseudomonadota bacterium]MBU1649131.1 peptidoglycan DD-metalloendopeptidase family protein [Pseudomonadota bacterium]
MKTTQTANNCCSSSQVLRQGIKSFYCSVILSLALLSFLTAGGAKATDLKAEKEAIEHKIESQSISISQLQQGLKRQQEQILEAINQERNLLTELEAIDMNLLEKIARLHTLEDSMTTQQELITAKEREINTIQVEKQKAQTHLQKRITAYYKTGKIGVINVAFSADTLPKLLSIHDSFSSLIQYDQDIMQQYRKTIEELEQTKKALTLEKNLLTNFINQASQEKEAIQQTRQEKNELLAQIRTQTKLHEQASQEIEKAAGDLSAQLAVMKEKKAILSQGFLMNKGKLPAPVSGRVLTLYGQSTKNKMGVEGVSAGIAIEAPDGTKVKAIFEGTILYAGYLRGYGNTIIIDHGFQYYTVVSRIEKLLKEEGDMVKAGEDIGVMGETATLVDEGLYFEIRHAAETEDPLFWLDKNKLSLP